MTQSEHEIRSLVNELSNCEGRGTQLVSIYIPPDKNISEVRNHVIEEHGEAANIKSKNTRKNVQEALSSIKSRLKYYDTPPENGLAIFSGAVKVGGGKTDLKTTVVDSLPSEIQSFQYHCDDHFLTEPLETLLSSGETYALLVIDRREAQIGKLNGTEINSITSVTTPVPGKHTKGGQSQARMERLRLEAIDDHYQRVAEAFNNAFVDGRHDLDGTLVGGPSPTKEEFLDRDYLHHELQDTVLGTVSISDTTENGLTELVDNSEDLIEEAEIIEEKKFMEQFFEELHNDELATYGFEKTREFANMGAIKTLLISEQFSKILVEYECENNHSSEELLPHNDTLNSCPKCGESVTVLDSERGATILAELAESRGSEVMFISAEFEKGEQFYQLGGVGGILRYRP